MGTVMFSRAVDPKLDAGRIAAVLTRTTLAVALVTAIPAFIFGPRLVRFVYGAQFADAGVALRLILPGIVAYSVVAVLSRYITGRGRPGTGTLILVAGLALNIGANLVLIPAYGIRGAAAASSLSYVVTAALTLIVFHRLSDRGLRETLIIRTSDVRALVAATRALDRPGPRPAAGTARRAAWRRPGRRPRHRRERTRRGTLAVGIRLVVIDDNPHLAWDGAIHPANATFERFVAAILDLPGSPVASITTVRAGPRRRRAAGEPAARPADPGRRAARRSTGSPATCATCPSLLRANRPTLSRAIAGADLVWLKVPASNAALAGAIATRAGVPRFVWVAGSAADVAAGRFDGARGVGGRAVGAGYDVVGRLVALGGRRLVVGADVVDGDGVVASLVEPSEVRDPAARAWPPAEPAAIRLGLGGTAGGRQGPRGAARGGRARSLALDARRPRRRAGPRAAARHRGRVRRTRPDHVGAATSPSARRISTALAAADVFVFPSPAEGFPKVVLDAFAVGLPVVATRAGALAELADAGLIDPIAASRRGVDPGRPGGTARARSGRGRRRAPARQRVRGRAHPTRGGRPAGRTLAHVVAGPAMGGPK